MTTRGGLENLALAQAWAAQLALFIGLWAVACNSDVDPPACPQRGATFRLQVTAGGEPLPNNTSLSVRYQGSLVEKYSLKSPPRKNVDVCCRRGEATEGALPAVPCNQDDVDDGGAAPSAIFCELWTEGIAEVVISASGYPEVRETLETPKPKDDCDHRTLDVTLTLEHLDAGSP